jgi:tRNA uridine 5-carbamoylmethylation protein Kti12
MTALLLTGAPSSGKTTLIRNVLARIQQPTYLYAAAQAGRLYEIHGEAYARCCNSAPSYIPRRLRI